MTLDDRYLTDLILDGDVPGLEEAAAVLDDFPDGRDALTGTRWIVHALSVGPVESVRWMLARGVDLAFEPDDGYTPLLSALERERPERIIGLQPTIRDRESQPEEPGRDGNREDASG